MFSFSLSGREPRGQNSHTCALRRRGSGFPEERPAFSPLHAGLFWDFCPPALSALQVRSPWNRTGGSARWSFPQENVCWSKEPQWAAKAAQSPWDRQVFVESLAFWKRTAHFKIKFFVNIYIKHAEINIWHQRLITVHAGRAYESE